MFHIEIAGGATEEITNLSAFDRAQVIDAIKVQLLHEPCVETRNRKPLRGLKPPWDHRESTWELRVGELRVFYDVDEVAKMVQVRAVRRKPPHMTTEQIL